MPATCATNLIAADKKSPGRDAWRQPFAAESIWNTPIGSGAIYKPAGLGPSPRVGVDTQFLLRTSEADSEREVLNSPSFKERSTGTTPLGFSLRLPDDWIVPETGAGNPYGLTPNANYAILMPDGDQVLQGCRVCRPTRGGPIFLPDWMKYSNNRKTVSIRGDGLDGGGHVGARRHNPHR